MHKESFPYCVELFQHECFGPGLYSNGFNYGYVQNNLGRFLKVDVQLPPTPQL